MSAHIGHAFFPEEFVVDLTVYQFGKPVKLKSYRYPVPEVEERKGIAFFIHGFGSYANHDADLVKNIVEKGKFEVFAIDQRGFGNSGGSQSVVENN